MILDLSDDESNALGLWYFNESPGWIGLQITERETNRKICLFVNRNMLSRTSPMMDSFLADHHNIFINTTVPLNIKLDSWQEIPQIITLSEWLLQITDRLYGSKNKRDLFLTPLKSGNDLKDSLLCMVC